MKNKLASLCLLAGVIGLCELAYANDNSVEIVIANDTKTIPFTSGVNVSTTESQIKVGRQIVKLTDGSCTLRTTKLIEMTKFETSVPGTYIEAPRTETSNVSVPCSEAETSFWSEH